MEVGEETPEDSATTDPIVIVDERAGSVPRGMHGKSDEYSA